MENEFKEIEEQIAQFPDEFKAIAIELMNQVAKRNQMIAWLRTELEGKEKLFKEKEEKIKEITNRLLEAERQAKQDS